MIDLLKKLFLSEEESDGLRQAQREATIDLLVLATYSDGLVHANEGRALERAAKRFSWRSRLPIEEYISASAKKAEQVRASEEKEDHYIRDIGIRLESRKHRNQALRLCNMLLYSDSDLQGTEVQFLQRVSKILGLK